MLNDFYSAFPSYALYTYHIKTGNEVLIYSWSHRNSVSLNINRINDTSWKYINLIFLKIELQGKF